jgi:PAS domain S-box-containing protein
MHDEQKTREQLLEEVRMLREQMARLRAETETHEWRSSGEEHAFLSGILDATPDFVGVADLNGRAVYLNRAARRMIGMADDEPAGNMCITDHHPLWVRQVFSEILPLLARDGFWSGETVMLSRGGREIPVSQVLIAHKTAPGEPVRFVSTIARDISATLIQSSGDMIISADANRNIIEFNPAA